MPRQSPAQLVCPWALIVPLLVAAPVIAEMTSPSFRMRGGHFNSAVMTRSATIDPQARVGSAAGSLCQAEPIGIAGHATGLQINAPGFWAVVTPGFPNLDTDGDGVPNYRDADDDGDQLLDLVESQTGVFMSQADTGTSSVIADSDSDSYDDGTEVALGSDPNDFWSRPFNSLPATTWGGAFALAAALGLLGILVTRRSGSQWPSIFA